jgi:hypothetical protein
VELYLLDYLKHFVVDYVVAVVLVDLFHHLLIVVHLKYNKNEKKKKKNQIKLILLLRGCFLVILLFDC